MEEHDYEIRKLEIAKETIILQNEALKSEIDRLRIQSDVIQNTYKQEIVKLGIQKDHSENILKADLMKVKLELDERVKNVEIGFKYSLSKIKIFGILFICFFIILEIFLYL
jgi:hypothetical protein